METNKNKIKLIDTFEEFLGIYTLKIKDKEGLYLYPDEEFKKTHKILKIPYKDWVLYVAKIHNININKGYSYYYSTVEKRKIKYTLEEILENLKLRIKKKYNNEKCYKFAFELYLEGKYKSIDYGFKQFLNIYYLSTVDYFNPYAIYIKEGEIEYFYLQPNTFNRSKYRKYGVLKFERKVYEDYIAHYFKIDRNKCESFYIRYPHYERNKDHMIIKIDSLYELKATIKQMYLAAYLLYEDGKYIRC